MEKQVKKMSTKALNRKKELMGTKYMTNEGYEVTIIDYETNKNVTVSFENGYITNAELTVIKEGRIKNPYHPSVYGIGYFGKGREKKINNENKRIYQQWVKLIHSIYLDDKLKNKPIAICEEWKNFQNFSKWYKENYYELEDEKTFIALTMAKNKIASADTVFMLPISFKITFSGCREVNKDLTYPRGVFYDKSSKKIRASINFNNKKYYLGTFNTIDEAENVYKTKREKLYLDLVESYKGRIPEEIYDKLEEININEY